MSKCWRTLVIIVSQGYTSVQGLKWMPSHFNKPDLLSLKHSCFHVLSPPPTHKHTNGTSINLVTPFGMEQALTPPQLMKCGTVMLTKAVFSLGGKKKKRQTCNTTKKWLLDMLFKAFYPFKLIYDSSLLNAVQLLFIFTFLFFWTCMVYIKSEAFDPVIFLRGPPGNRFTGEKHILIILFHTTSFNKWLCCGH